MTYTYPYPSRNRKNHAKLRSGQDYTLWGKEGFDIKAAIENIKEPIIEIGGPTDDGFYFLDDLELSTKPLITNITATPPASEESKEEFASHVNEMIDGRKMPYDNTSVGMFLMAGMTMTNDWYMQLPEHERDSKIDQIEKEFDVARLEMEQVAIGVLNPGLVNFAQRVQIYVEMYRSLIGGGFLVTDGSVTEMNILQRIGFDIVAFTQEFIRPDQNWDGIYYEVVAVKPSEVLEK